jgi:hypothetical protein
MVGELNGAQVSLYDFFPKSARTPTPRRFLITLERQSEIKEKLKERERERD